MGLRNKKEGAGTEEQRIIDFGHPEHHPPFADNSVKTFRYSLLSFLPLAVREQFRRNGNVYFLCIGLLMFVGYYSPLFYSAIPPWTTLGPLALVVSVSLAQEGYTDLLRHRSDNATNSYPCTVLRRSEDIDRKQKWWKKKRERKRDPRMNGGKDMKVRVPGGEVIAGGEVPIAFERLQRMDIRAGDIVYVRNREMIPADLILLASSNEGGNAYVETSSIDGETNLKLRNSPQLPIPRGMTSSASSNSLFNGGQEEQKEEGGDTIAESLVNAVTRVVKMSTLGHPDGVSALANPSNAGENLNVSRTTVKMTPKVRRDNMKRRISGDLAKDELRRSTPKSGEKVQYIASLTSEPPNPHVNNYSGKLTLPPDSEGAPSVHAPLNAENILLRGAVLRNTDWVIGVACFTGADTKLVMNSVATPSKFSQLDMLINRNVVLVFFIMVICVSSLAVAAVSVTSERFDQLWYTGFSKDPSEPWPYFNLETSSSIGPPVWTEESQNFLQNLFMFVTLLSNFIPLSLYVSVEMVTLWMMLYIGSDIHMYHEETDTPAAARSTIVTDLGLVEYIFSDKTGTLTCNVMEFKRCSVDGHPFGMPIAKTAPKTTNMPEDEPAGDSELVSDSSHPLRNLLAGSSPMSGQSQLKEATEGVESSYELECLSDTLTFNAEMFLRVMSLCHTVVVEKHHVAEDRVVKLKKSKWGSHFSSSPSSASGSDVSGKEPKSPKSTKMAKKTKKKSGAPDGYDYQAESPDEGALVAAASNEFGFQLLGRNSSGVEISVPCPSLFENNIIVEGLKNGTMTAKTLAAQTAGDLSKYSDPQANTADSGYSRRSERWPILAINKFDSDRKRMSVLVRSPPELGSIPMLLCKGADSSMLVDGVCEGVRLLNSVVDKDDSSGARAESKEENSELDSLLGIQAHLGEFASEGLRTLVLGVKILSEDDTQQWLSKFTEASTAIEGRDKKLAAVAYEIEQDLHIVGATAIEDKLQDGVPETISKLEKAGIKLWVLTGDKRETAIEIGYSTQVLTPQMHLTEVVDGPPQNVKALVAMELMRHIKIGNLPDYQLAALDDEKGLSVKSVLNSLTLIGYWWRKTKLAFRWFYLKAVKRLWLSKDKYKDQVGEMEDEEEAEKRRADIRIHRRKVRDTAKEIIYHFWRGSGDHPAKESPGKHAHDDDASIVTDDPPAVFERAKSAKESLKTRRRSVAKKEVADAATVKELALGSTPFDEEVLSMKSFLPTKQVTNFDSKRRTVLERVFAVDKDVRHGRLTKHLKSEYKEALAIDREEEVGKKEIEAMVGESPDKGAFQVSSVKRGLILEGAALKHILGDPILEEMLFAVASCSESVIACRVSPIQKALLLKMVRKYVSPTPTTLAIGDGANDVGMIQEAHIGIGISGLEGQQAVNASDFAIAQFRFLQPLLLIHGRWNFMRMSKVVLFFFYKNTVLIGTLMVYADRCLYSGQPLYDPWVISVFNFVGASVPVVMMGIFDRDLPRDYVLRNPQVYQCGPTNEFLSFRMTLRTVVMTIIQVYTVYFFSAPAIQMGGGVTSAFKGLMGNWDRDIPGDGEGGDWQVFGTTVYTQLIYVVTLKALYETRSIVHGEFPTFTCRKGKGEGWWNRIGYSWVGVTCLSLGFYYFFIYTYQYIGMDGPQQGTFFPMVGVTTHVFNMRSVTWAVSMLAPTMAVIFDVTGKVFSNMYYPTQTQIHMEIAATE